MIFISLLTKKRLKINFYEFKIKSECWVCWYISTSNDFHSSYQPSKRKIIKIHRYQWCTVFKSIGMVMKRIQQQKAWNQTTNMKSQQQCYCHQTKEQKAKSTEYWLTNECQKQKKKMKEIKCKKWKEFFNQ